MENLHIEYKEIHEIVKTLKKPVNSSDQCLRSILPPLNELVHSISLFILRKFNQIHTQELEKKVSRNLYLNFLSNYMKKYRECASSFTKFETKYSSWLNNYYHPFKYLISTEAEIHHATEG